MSRVVGSTQSESQELGFHFFPIPLDSVAYDIVYTRLSES